MEPDCILCEERVSNCDCPPDKVRIAELEAEVAMLNEAIEGWRSECARLRADVGTDA